MQMIGATQNFEGNVENREFQIVTEIRLFLMIAFYT